MTLPRLESLCDYWSDLPPTHALVAGYVGYKKPNKPSEPETHDNIDELAGLFAQMGGTVERGKVNG